MALFGTIGEFIESRETWSQYAERIEQFFVAKEIVAERKKPIFLSTIGPAAYHTLGNLVAPKKSSQEGYVQLLKHMSDFYNPKPSVTMQRYRFPLRAKLLPVFFWSVVLVLCTTEHS